MFFGAIETPSVAPRQTHCNATVPMQLVQKKRWWDLNFYSGTRDAVAWPTASEWRHASPEMLRNVVSVVVVQALLPRKEYNVSVWGNRVDILLGGVQYNVELPVGQYADGTALATALTTAITTTDAALAGCLVSYDTLTDRMSVTFAGPVFSLLWRTGTFNNVSLWRVMGWSDRLDTAPGVTQSSVGRINLEGVQVLDVFVTEFTNAVHGPVARILLKPGPGNTDTTYFDSERCRAHTFWPVGRVTNFSFRFMVAYAHMSPTGEITPDYRPYDFNGCDVYLTIGVETLEYEDSGVKVVLDPST